MKDEYVQLDSIYWTSFFLSRPQGTDVQWRVVKVIVTKRITETWCAGGHNMEKVSFQCKCIGYEKPHVVPAVYWKGGTPEQYLKEFQYGDWDKYGCCVFSAEDLYLTAEDCIRAMYERQRLSVENLKRELDRGDYKSFDGDLVIGILPKLEEQ